MRRFFSRSLLLACLAAGAAGCGNSTSTLTGSTTTPTTPLTTETFSGTLTTNGASSYHFAAGGAGSVTASLTTIGTTVPVSLVLGTWNGTVCQMILSNDNAVQGTTVVGQVSAASNLCVRIADATGNVPSPSAYTITVTHP